MQRCRPTTRSFVARLLATAATLVVTGQALAVQSPAGPAQDCQTRALKQPFSSWGDANDYFLAPGGSFENGLVDWMTSSNPSISAENEPWKRNGSTDRSSVKLPAGSSIRSRAFCFRANEDTIRAFVKRPGLAGARLYVSMMIETADGQTGSTLYTIDGSTPGWTPTPPMSVPMFGWSGDLWLTVYFTPEPGTPGTWKVDDFFVDPLKCC